MIDTTAVSAIPSRERTAEQESTITIRFSRCATPTLMERLRDHTILDYSMLICKLTHSPFSHVDYVIELSRWNKPGQYGLLGASNNPSAPYIIGNPRGVAVRPVEYQRFAIRRDAELAVTPDQKACYEKFLIEQIGKPFDRTALEVGTFLSPRFDRDWRSDGRWYCAELQGRAVETCNLLGYEYPGIKNRLTAADLLIFLAPKLNFAKFNSVIPGLPLAGDWES